MPKKHKYLQTLKSTDMLEKSQHRNKLLRAKIEKIKRAEPLLAPPLIFR
jgi:inactivated superfamily I helicase